MAAVEQRFYRAAEAVPPGGADTSDQQSSAGSFTRVGGSEASRTRNSTNNSQERPNGIFEWIWCQAAGWIKVPNTSISFLDGSGDAKVWVSKQNVWGYVPEDVIWQATPESSVLNTGTPEVADLEDWYTDGWKSKYKEPQEKESDIPEWDGVSISRTQFFRKIQIWESITRMPKDRRGVKLLARLTGDAFEKLENVNPGDVQDGDNSVEKFKQYVVDAYEPIEDFRTGKVMDY